MKVLVESITIGRVSGRSLIECESTDAVGTIIEKFLREKGLQHKSKYILMNSKDVVLEKTRTLGACGVLDEDVLYLDSEYRDDDEMTFGISNWVILSVVALIIGLVGIIMISVYFAQVGKGLKDDYGVVMDAGSSHTRVTVYKWPGGKLNGTGVVKQVNSKQCENDGISSYSANVSEAGAALQPCLDFGKRHVRSGDIGNTPVFLGATAGMRLLDIVDKNASDAVLDSIKKTFRESGFEFEENHVRIISGEEEGTFAWVTANFLRHLFDPLSYPVNTTVGALDMGGASTQITFQQAGNPTYVMLYGQRYTVFAQSYLCQGKHEAQLQFMATLVKESGYKSAQVPNPCGPTGNSTHYKYSDLFSSYCTRNLSSDDSTYHNMTYEMMGTSDARACYGNVVKLRPDVITHPNITGEKFMAFSAFYYVSSFLNITNVTLDDYNGAVTTFCGKSWDEIKDIPAHDTSDLPYYCFDGSYTRAVLQVAYGFNTSEKWALLNFTNTVGGADLGWSLGFMMNATNTIPAEVPAEKPISALSFSLLLLLFLAFLLLAVGFGWYAYRTRRGAARYQPVASGGQYGTV